MPRPARYRSLGARTRCRSAIVRAWREFRRRVATAPSALGVAVARQLCGRGGNSSAGRRGILLERERIRWLCCRTLIGSVPEWPMGAGCKPAGLRLRRFKSFSAHIESKREGPVEIAQPGRFVSRPGVLRQVDWIRARQDALLTLSEVNPALTALPCLVSPALRESRAGLENANC
jgi:hypothetical protein